MTRSYTWKPLLLIALAAALWQRAPGAEAIRVLVLTGRSDPSHDWRQTSEALERVLGATGRFAVQIEVDPSRLQPATLAGFEVLIVNYNGPRWGEHTEKAIEEFVAQGKGLVSFHGVSYGPFMGTSQQGKQWIHRPETAWRAWPEILGAFWAPGDIGHSISHTFRVRILDHAHPITRGMPQEFSVRDELYHRMSLRAEARVLAVAYDDPQMRGTGKDEPICWVVPWGRGRAFHTTLGHDHTVLRQPGVATLLCRATEWAATASVTLPGWLEQESLPPR